MSVGGTLNLGRDVIADRLIDGNSYTPYDNANAHLAIGNSAAAFSRAHTDLQGASKARLPMLATYPQRTGNAIAFHAEADGSTANFAWNEWGIDNDSSAGDLFCRFVQDLGVKGSGATWQAQATVTIVLPS